jgi:hypothetical protein
LKTLILQPAKVACSRGWLQAAIGAKVRWHSAPNSINCTQAMAHGLTAAVAQSFIILVDSQTSATWADFS